VRWDIPALSALLARQATSQQSWYFFKEIDGSYWRHCDKYRFAVLYFNSGAFKSRRQNLQKISVI
jgi:hypothetical protein